MIILPDDKFLNLNVIHQIKYLDSEYNYSIIITEIQI